MDCSSKAEVGLDNAQASDGQLNWDRHESIAKTEFGEYRISWLGIGYSYFTILENVGTLQASRTREAAKAAAQLDYENRRTEHVSLATLSATPVEVKAGDVTDDMLNVGQERLCQLSPRTSFDDFEQAEIYKAMRAADPLFQKALTTLESYADPTGYTDSNGDQLPADEEVHQGLLAKETAAYLLAASAGTSVSTPMTGEQQIAAMADVLSECGLVTGGVPADKVSTLTTYMVWATRLWEAANASKKEKTP